MGRTMASNLSRLDMFPGETQEMEVDDLDRHPSQHLKRVENRRVGEIWVPPKDKPDDYMYNVDLLGHQNRIQAGTVYREPESDLRRVQ